MFLREINYKELFRFPFLVMFSFAQRLDMSIQQSALSQADWKKKTVYMKQSKKFADFKGLIQNLFDTE